MKWIFIVLLLLSPQLLYADFITASDAYDKHKYKSAYKEFKELAALGNKRAQYNIAVMTMRGDGIKSNYTEAYGWASLAQSKEHPEFASTLQLLKDKLSPDQLIVAQERATSLEMQYGSNQIYTALAPITYSDPTGNTSSEHDYEIEVLHRQNPTYPKNAAIKGMQGWVTLQFDINADGSVHKTRVLDSFPPQTFDEVSIKAIKKWRFKATYLAGINPHPIAATQTVAFKLAGKSTEAQFEKEFNHRLKTIKQAAENGNPYAQYLYAVTASASGLLNVNSTIKASEANKWLLKSAQNGNIDAQYLLGKNIIYGKGCKTEKQKGLFWVAKSAQNGNDLAARMTYELLKSDDIVNHTGKTMKQWLAQSAIAGNPDSMQEWARMVASAEQPTKQEIATARKYLKDSLWKRSKDADWYRTSAELYLKENNPKKAKRDFAKAEKLKKNTIT